MGATDGAGVGGLGVGGVGVGVGVGVGTGVLTGEESQRVVPHMQTLSAASLRAQNVAAGHVTRHCATLSH